PEGGERRSDGIGGRGNTIHDTVTTLISRHFPAAVIEWASDLGGIQRVVSVVPMASEVEGTR
ncbi:MAG: hypothetical protein ACLFVD_01185, partial [Dehalococcoidia bacterium]